MDESNPYSTQTSASLLPSRPEPRRSLALLIVAMLLATCVSLTILGTRRAFREMMDEFEVDGPLVSVLATSWTLPLVLLLLAAISGVLEYRKASPSVANGWNVSVMGVATLSGTVYVFGVVMLILKMIGDLSQ